MNSKKVRSSNIELLRIILIIMVIFLHFSNRDMGGGLNYVTGNSINESVVRFLQAFSICAVDVFIIITGFFMSEKSEIDLKKPIVLWISVIVFQIITYLLLVIFKFEIFGLSSMLFKLVPLNWYIMLYNVLYILIPVMNKVLKRVNIKDNKKYVFLILTIFAIYPSFIDIIKGILNIGDIPGLSTVSIFGNEHGYSIINFMLLYFIGAFIKKASFEKKFVPIIVFFLNSIIITSLSYFTEEVWNYNNVFVIINAICIFQLFINLNFKYNRLINAISQSVLGIYVIHPYLIGHVTKYISLIEIGKISLPSLFLKIILFIIVVFIGSLIVFIIGNFFVGFIKLIIFKILDCLNVNTKIKIS